MKTSHGHFLVFPNLRTNYQQKQTLNLNKRVVGQKVSCPKFEQDLRQYSNILHSNNFSKSTQSVSKLISIQQHAKRSFDKSFGATPNINILKNQALGKRSLQKTSFSSLSSEYLNIVNHKKVQLQPVDEDEPFQPEGFSFKERSYFKEQLYASFARFDTELQRNPKKVQDDDSKIQKDQIINQEVIKNTEIPLILQSLEPILQRPLKNNLQRHIENSVMGEQQNLEDFNFLDNLSKDPIQEAQQLKKITNKQHPRIQNQDKENEQKQAWGSHKKTMTKKITEKFQESVKQQGVVDPNWSIYPYKFRETTVQRKSKKFE